MSNHYKQNTVTAFEIVDHGVDHAQYFQGCGVSYTDFECVVTGCGSNAKEAFSDALEQICSCESVDVSPIERSREGRSLRSRRAERASVYAHLRDAGEIKRGEDMPDDCELYYYVSVRYSLAWSDDRLAMSAGLHVSQTGCRRAAALNS